MVYCLIILSVAPDLLHGVLGRVLALLLEVPLVVVLRGPEDRGVHDLGDDGRVVLRLDGRDALGGGLRLRPGVGVDPVPVLRPGLRRSDRA